MEWIHDLADSETLARGRDAVALNEGWALIERFTTLIRESGSADERTAAEYIAARLRYLGIEPIVHDPALYLSVPEACELELLGDGGGPLPCKVPAFSRSTSPEWVEGEVVEVATGAIRGTAGLFQSAAESDLGNVRGKIVLAHGYAMPRIVTQLQAAGAAAAICMNPGHSHEGIVTPVWGTPGLSDRDRIPDFVALNAPRAVGEALQARLRSGPTRVRIRTRLRRGWFHCPVVEVVIPGRDRDFVLIHGHYDSWHEGIGDNAVGNAALLEVARVVNSMRDQLPRGLRVVWWPGHSTGRYAGSTWYADEMAMLLRDHCVAQIDVDSPGCRWATAYEEVMWMAEAEGLARAAIRGGAAAEAHRMRPLRAGDWSFNQIGLTGLFMLLSNIPAQERAERSFYPVGGCGGNSDAWHTERDLLEVADRENLARDIRVYLEAVLRLATSPMLPYDHRAAVAEIAAAASDYASVAEHAFDVAPLLSECTALRGDLDAMYERAAAAAKRGESLQPFDRAQLALSRELVPVNYARRRYYHDPALETPAVPDLSVLRQWPTLDAEGRRFLLADALRGRNRVIDALKRARERIAPLLA